MRRVRCRIKRESGWIRSVALGALVFRVKRGQPTVVDPFGRAAPRRRSRQKSSVTECYNFHSGQHEEDCYVFLRAPRSCCCLGCVSRCGSGASKRAARDEAIVFTNRPVWKRYWVSRRRPYRQQAGWRVRDSDGRSVGGAYRNRWPRTLSGITVDLEFFKGAHYRLPRRPPRRDCDRRLIVQRVPISRRRFPASSRRVRVRPPEIVCSIAFGSRAGRLRDARIS
jgi:hypothetical protein